MVVLQGLKPPFSIIVGNIYSFNKRRGTNLETKLFEVRGMFTS
jgi:hypothetical protein